MTGAAIRSLLPPLTVTTGDAPSHPVVGPTPMMPLAGASEAPPPVAESASHVEAEPSPADPRARHHRFNSWMLAIDGGFFTVFAAAFAFQTTMPAYARWFTENAYVLAAFPLLWFFGAAALQPWGAYWVQGRARVRGYLMVMGTCQRLPYVALALLAFGAQAGRTSDAAGALALYALGAVVSALAIPLWIEYVGRTVEPARRGRALGLRLVVSSVGGAAAALAVNALLNHPSLGFPDNYAAVFVLGAGSFLLSLAPLALCRETPVAAPPRPPFAVFARQLVRVWRRDGSFRRYLWAQFFGSAYLMNIALFVTVGQDLAAPGGERAVRDAFVGQATVAFFLSQGVAGWLIGRVMDRRGAVSAVAVCLAAGVATPIAALLVPYLARRGEHGPAATVAVAFLAVFVLEGVLQASYFSGSVGYVLERAPTGSRLAYLALNDTFRAPAYLGFALLGPWLAVNVGAGWSFAAAAACSALGLWLLRGVRGRAAAPEEPAPAGDCARAP